MISPLDFLRDLLNPDLAFLPKALAVAVLSSAMCGVVGCHVVLRGMAFVGHAVAHAVFPGLAIAFVLQGSLLIGGLAAGLCSWRCSLRTVGSRRTVSSVSCSLRRSRSGS